MNRFTLCLYFALLIGAAACGGSPQALYEPVIPVPTAPPLASDVPAAAAEMNRRETNGAADEVAKEEEAAAFEILRPTLRKWLRGEPVATQLTSAAPAAIRKIFGKDESALTVDERGWLDELRFFPELLDANGDGRPELVVRDRCAPVGNCRVRIFEKRGRGYRIVLGTLSGAVQTLKFRAAKTKNYYDLETRDHADAWSGTLDVYRFDGKIYRARECFDYSYSELKDGKMIEFAEPRLTPRACGR